MSDLGKSLSDLSPAKRELLELLLAEEGRGPARTSLAARPWSSAEAPLGWAQRRLWLLHRVDGESAAYNLPRAVRLRGRLDATALAWALGEIARRHEALRTTFPADAEGEPVQRIAPPAPLRPPFVHLGGLPEAAREAEARRLVASDSARPFDLAAGPLLRVLLLRLAAEDHVVLVNMHHIVSDGWSMGLFIHEMTVLYAAFLEGRPSPLPPLPIQYRDFTDWHREWMSGERWEQDLAYWREQLAGAPALLDLPTDRPRTAARRPLAATVPVAVPEEVAERLRRLAAVLRATPFAVLLAGFQTLLLRHSGQEDIVVGTPVAGRPRVETEGLIGFFVNTLALRLRPLGELPFQELVRQAREAVLAAQLHDQLPFDLLVEELRPERSLLHAPFFQVVLAFDNTPGAVLRMPGLEVERVEAESGAAKYDLILTLRASPDGLAGDLEYRRDLWDAATVERMAVHLRTLLAAAAAAPNGRLGELQLLALEERRQLLVEWRTPAGAPPPRASIAALFAEQVRRRPDAPAVEAGGRRLSYRELDRHAGALARELRRQGIRRGARVGVCAERSLELVVAVVAVLKAGAAYVPLDPAYPRERLARILADAGVELTLVEPRLRAVLPERARQLPLAVDPAAPAGTQTEPLIADEDRGGGEFDEVGADDLAYVMYTSGSTGRPKGVAVPHRAVVRLVRGGGFADLDDRQVFLMLAPLAFDASTLELWGPLANGGRLVVPPPGNLSLAELGRTIARSGATTLWLTAGLFHLMAEEQLEALRPLRQLLAGGDVLRPAAVAAVLRRLPALRLVNGYGPTENTTFTACHAMTAGEPLDAAAPVPIGRPIGNTSVVLLDRRLEPAPIGVPGELHAGGDGLAWGYVGRPELTAERFVPDPFAGAGPGSRLYRTGDLARWRPTGVLEFLGRRDAQVKIRGFRVELEEVEAALAAQRGVAAAAVAAPVDAGGERRLVGYVVPAGDSRGEAGRPAPAELLERLAERLPGYMLPGRVVFLPALPLTPNGKVDRRALQQAAGEAPVREEGAGAPRSLLEELLAGIWAEVLEVPRVGTEDDFFALGGHSLKATQVAARVRKMLGVELPLGDLFAEPTVAALAARIERLRAAAGGGLAAMEELEPELVPRVRPPHPPLSFAQQRLWFIDQLDPGNVAYNIPAPLWLAGALDVPALARACDEIVRRHESLRTTFEVWEGGPWQRVHAAPLGPALSWTADLTALPGGRREAAARKLVRGEARRPFDLTQGPLVRIGLLRLAAREHLLLANMHHIVSDGWSLGVMTRELGALYRAGVAAAPGIQAADAAPPLPALPIQYADFALWQRRRAQGDGLAGELAYWRRQLAGAPPVLDLPADRPRPAVRSPHGGTVERPLGPALSAGVSALARRAGATPFVVLLTAFQALLARLSGEADVSVGTPIAGRTRLETEALIGFFVNTLVLRLELAPGAGMLDLVRRGLAVALAAHAHQAIPFERLVEELEPQRSLRYTPLFQVLFALQNAPVPALELPGLALRSAELGGGTAKFDLTLGITQGSPAGRGRGDDGLSAALEYRTDLFEKTTAARLLGRYEALLAAMVEEPDLPWPRLPLLAAAEREELLRLAPGPPLAGLGGLDVGEADGSPACLHQLFERQAAAQPQAPAVVALAGGATLSYGDLDLRAERLAARLRRLGAGPEVRIGVCLERTPALVVGLLAVLKSGGAYVPIDPAYPPARVEAILDDARAAVLLTERELLPRLPPLAGVPVLMLDAADAANTAAGAGPERAPLAPAPDNLAYVIFTSGSTGRPKGIAIPHRAAVGRITWALSFYRPGDLAGVLAATSITFDISVFELFATLAAGGTLILARDALALAAPAAAKRTAPPPPITLVDTVPSAMAELLRLGAVPPGARVVNLAGEPLPGALVEQLYALPAVERVYNLYGPSEDTTFSTVFLAERGAGREPAIGRPLAGSRAYVVDRGGELAPPGVAGELLLGGAGQARGYLGRPELTAERFVPDMVSGRAGERLYRSGDLARWRPDGELEYLGRFDHQVKVRGFRIELGEIEAALAGLPGVQEAAVAARPEPTPPAPPGAPPPEPAAGPPPRRLVAYVVAAPGAPEPRIADWKRRLAERLPDYMVPALFVVLPGLPRTPNGKVDRQALPDPAADGQPARAARSRPPRTLAEEVLAGIWGSLLGLPQVGAEESFFDLGGHSLLATQVVLRVRQAFGVDLEVRELFDTPTVAALAERIERRWMEGSAEAGGVLEAAVAAGLERPPRPPLSFAQQRLWFIDQLEPGSAAYNIPAALRLEGALDEAVLGRALAEIVRRHETLRTTFEAEDGEPWQRVHPAAGEAALAVVDLRALAAAAREGESARLLRADARQGFDLARGPLFRRVLLRLGERDHLLVATLHHIVGDGWSLGVLTRELAALYRAFAAGEPSPLPALPVQYADFALWQRRFVAGDRLEADLDYWRRRLGGAPALLGLPADRPRPAVQTLRGATVQTALDPALSAAVAALARRAGATPFIVFLAALQTLLARLSGQADVSVGTPIAGRTQIGTEALIGFFANTLVLRAEIEAGQSFLDLVRRALERTLEAHAHQTLPFERLVEELEPRRSLSYTPLFQVLFALQVAAPPLALEGLVLSLPPPGGETAKFDLTLGITQASAGGQEVLIAGLEYATDLFDGATARRLLGCFETLLAAAVDGPERPWERLPLLSAAERRELVALAAAAPLGDGAPADACLHGLVERRAAERPEAPAVALLAGGEPLRYGELDRRAARLAARLKRLGVGPEVCVGVCLERTPDLVAALLAVLKAGGAYVPLDPFYPAARLAAIVGDARPAALVTSPALAGRLPAGTPIVTLDAAEEDGAALPPADAAATPENLAYVIFTSGSTGRPKGIAIRHRAAVARVAWAVSLYAPADLAGVLASTSIAFDMSVFEIFATLAAGGTLILARDALALTAAPAAPGGPVVTLVDTVPSAMAELLDMGAVPPSARVVNLGGEPLSADLVERLYALPAVERIYNLYGPSEDTTFSTCHLAERGAGEPPIGRPLPGTRAFVVDGEGEPVPPGVAGELLLGGVGLARGYLGRPELTAERFVPDPLSGLPGERLYRTGDLARRRAGGELEYLGRSDFQVKVRGFRIELGEIEAALAACPGVRAAAVVARRGVDAPFEQPAGAPFERLVAYVAADGPAAPSAADLRRALAERLPDYMVPAAFVALPSLPRTATGKVDRRALQDLDAAPAGTSEDAAPLAPRDEVELALLHIWEEVLPDRRRVGVRDPFFKVGGHSLLAVRLLSRIRRRLGAELPLASLFAEGTIERQAALVRRQRDGGGRPAAGGSALVEVRAGGAAPPFVCVHPVGGSVLCYVELARQLDAATPGGRPFWGLQALPEAPARSVGEMADRYLAELTAALPDGPYLLGGWSMGARVAFEMACRLRRAGRPVGLVALLDPQPAAMTEVPGDLLAWFARDLAGLSGEAAAELALAYREDGGREDDAAAIERLCAWGRRTGALPADVDGDLVRRRFELFRANQAAALAHRPEVYPETIELVLADGADGAGDGRGWPALAAGARVQRVPGGHYGLLREATARDWAAALGRALARARFTDHPMHERVRK